MNKLLTWLKSLFKSVAPQKKKKWRLVPNKNGTYNLEKWHCEVQIYLVEVVNIEASEADKYIERLERDVIYYREGEHGNNT